MNNKKKPFSNATHFFQDNSNHIAGIVQLFIIVAVVNHLLKRDLESYTKAARKLKKKKAKDARKRKRKRRAR
ncbi:MAG: hypothetical protein ACI4E1_03330 [Lachnospira sp.]